MKITYDKGTLYCLGNEKVLKKDPRSDKKYMFRKKQSYARFVLENHLGRKLERNEVVYHLDGDVYNNEISNLEVITRAELIRRNSK